MADSSCAMRIVRVPLCLFNTRAGGMLADRMTSSSWVLLADDEIPVACVAPCVHVSAAKKLSEKKIAKVKPDSYHVCGFCNAYGKHKCANCLRQYYCSAECQRKHWPVHKAICTPAEDMNTNSLALVLPDFPVCYQYRDFVEQSEEAQSYGILIQATTMFEQTCGQGSIERTLLCLALKGKPHPNFVNVFY